MRNGSGSKEWERESGIYIYNGSRNRAKHTSSDFFGYAPSDRAREREREYSHSHSPRAFFVFLFFFGVFCLIVYFLSRVQNLVKKSPLVDMYLP